MSRESRKAVSRESRKAVSRESRKQGIEQGIEQGQVAVLVQLVARKFGQGTAEEVQQLIVGSAGRDRIAWVAAAILDCDTPEEFLVRVRED